MSAPLRIAVIVANDVSSDSRVIKTAASARRMGADVMIVGTSTTSRRDDSMIGDIPVVRVPISPSGTRGRRIVSRSDGRWLIRPLAPLAFGSSANYGRAADARTERRRRTRERIERIKHDLASRTSRGSRAVSWARLQFERSRALVLDGWFVVRRRAHVRPPIAIGGVDRRGELELLLSEQLPFVAGYVNEMVPVLWEFEPDLIHAHDIFMAAVGTTYARRAGAAGRRVRWIYDAHEWVAGLRAERAIPKTVAADGLERLVAPAADGVLTVGEALAGELVAGLGLADRPTVVLNAPPEWRDRRADAGQLRSTFALGDAPVLVYPGVVKPKRGLDTVVAALTALADVHLVLLADVSSQHVADLVAEARRLGVDDRVHVHPYVPPDRIAPFISDATAGIYPLTHYPNAEIAVPTKLLEYVQAGLPVVVSDTREMAEFVHRHGIGEVFVSGDADDFAVAARQVIADRWQYVARYSADLMRELSWERQEALLCAAYATALGRDDLVLADAPFLQLVETARSQ
ncbi:MAG: glycosyltransferase [Ilumatobacter sp.]|uniref:glycosyltransferase n=1 Tax=Ilumatobacter sp. TaxID=1967498 RepID=UPI0026326D81|nr:glycosyltransferase [Ilumatobacter sp.]MDJ0768359.1 glycosyltransferase [Ilumatobacter sp.]